MRAPRVSVAFDEATWVRLTRFCIRDRRTRTEAVRMAVEAFLRSPETQAGVSVDGWRADPHSQQRFNGATLSYLRSPHSAEGGHEVAVAGRRLWVLPDGRTSGQRRSRLITQALAVAQSTAEPEVDPICLVAGVMWVAQAGVLVYRSGE